MNSADRVDRALTEIADQRWSGPERDERIERLIREVHHMKQEQSKKASKSRLIAVGIVGLLGGGAVAGVVTHQILAQRVVIVDENGNHWEGVLTPTGDGEASGEFITEDGTVYQLEVNLVDDHEDVTASVEGEAGGTATFIIEPTVSPEGELVPQLKAGDGSLEEVEIEGDGGN